MAKLNDLLMYLNESNVPYHVVEHAPAFAAHDVAAATHLPNRALAKTLMLHIDGKFWMAVIRADQRVDEKRVKRSFSASHVHLAREEELRSLFPDCELGAMPPFGNLYALPVIVDHGLAEDEEIVFNACTHTQSVKMKYRDYKKLVHPLVGDIATTAPGS
jgi:Ala-tRNA(Pro) deacylase